MARLGAGEMIWVGLTDNPWIPTKNLTKPALSSIQMEGCGTPYLVD
ncbi:MAG: hypothetical protein RIE73_11310 [Coleofasciculus sp. C1-SOL-03]